MVASSQSTNSPSIQIFSDLVIGIVAYSLSAMASPISEVDAWGTAEASYASTALVMREAASASPRKSRSMAAETMAAIGLARPVPAMSGADPWTGSNSDGPVLSGLRFAEAARPMPPEMAPPRSVRMSPKRLSVTMTSYRSGDSTKWMDAASTWLYAVVTSGYSS